MAKPSSTDALLQRLQDRHEKVVVLRERTKDAEREFHDLTREFEEELHAFRELLRAWRDVHGNRDDLDLWPPGFTDPEKGDDYGPCYFRAGSDLDQAAWELQLANGHELHVDELIDRIHQRTGRKIAKTSLVSSMSKLAKANHLFERVGPNTFSTRASHERSREALRKQLREEAKPEARKKRDRPVSKGRK